MTIYVTGIGVVSAIGVNAGENFMQMQTGETGINFSPSLGSMVGEVKLTNEQLTDILNLPDEDYSRTALLGLAAAKEAWALNEHDKEIRTGLVSATSVGGMDRTENYYRQAFTGGSQRFSKVMTHDNARTTDLIAAQLGISGYIGTISTACSSGANSIMQGARMLLGNLLDRVIVGGTDAIAEFNLKGFSSLNIYNREICKPFDNSKKGMNLGEGAAYLILENERSLLKSGNKPLCLLTGWDNASDAFHQTASSPDGTGATIAMKNALSKAHLSPGDISYINVHGTGTGNNDLSESMALKNVFGECVPPFSSTKGFTGHTLAASGAIEAVFCVQALLAGAFLPNINFFRPNEETGLTPVTSFVKEKSINHVLSNSFGFGGNCSSLIFSKIK